MVAQYVWVGVAAGFLFVGLWIGYAIFGSENSGSSIASNENENLLPAATQATIQEVDPRLYMQQNPETLVESVIQNEQASRALMNDNEFQRMMIEHMKEDHQMTQNTILAMMDDPQLRVHLIGHMWDNKEFLNEVRELLEQNSTTSDDHHMME